MVFTRKDGIFMGYVSFRRVPLGILAHLLRMVMEPKYLSEEVIVHLNHPLTRWARIPRVHNQLLDQHNFFGLEVHRFGAPDLLLSETFFCSSDAMTRIQNLHMIQNPREKRNTTHLSQFWAGLIFFGWWVFGTSCFTYSSSNIYGRWKLGPSHY